MVILKFFKSYTYYVILQLFKDLCIYIIISGRVYFDAVKNYGFKNLLEKYATGNRCSLVNFMKTHLSGCAKEMYMDLLNEFLKFLYEGINGVGAPTPDELHHIIHYQSNCSAGSLFSKTALNWANENNDKVISLELLKLEKKVHHEQRCGLECLKDNLSSDTLLPWIIETYKNLYEQSRKFVKCQAFMIVCLELVLFSYMPFIYDYYSDVTLAMTYKGIADANESMRENVLWSCDGEKGNLSLARFHENSSVSITELFDVAFWVTNVTIILSTLIYIYIVVKHSNPKCVNLLHQNIIKFGTERKIHVKLSLVVAKLLAGMLSVATKLLWPIIHVIRKFKYYAAQKRSEHKDLTTESDDSWNVIKTAEYGIESSLQLCLQIWLLKPFFSEVTRWDQKELIIRSVHGIVHFITFSVYPACYIERALGKILLTIVMLALGVAIMKSTKPGMGACERPLKTLPIFISILAQTVARILAFRSLIIMKASSEIYKYVPFFLLHIFFLLIIKIMFETRWSLNKLKEIPVLNTLKFLISALSSTIIMVHIHEETSSCKRRQFSFLPHLSFFFLVLVENLTLAILPFAMPSLYPDYEYFPFDSHVNTIICVIVLWFVSVMFQVRIIIIIKMSTYFKT